MKKKLQKLLILIMPFLLAGVLLRMVSTLFILPLLLFSLLNMNRHEAACSLSLFLCPVFGIIFQVFHIPIAGTIPALFILIVLLKSELIYLFRMHASAFRYLAILVFVFLLFYMLGKPIDQSHDKILILIQTILVSTAGILVLATNKDIDFDKLAILLLYSGILYVAIPLDYMYYATPSGLFDFEFYRNSTTQFLQGGTYITYHTLGICGMMAATMLLAKNKFNSWSKILIMMSLWLVMLSGARQTLAGIVIAFAMWYYLTHKRGNTLRNVLFILAFIYIVVQLLLALDVEWITTIFEDSGQGFDKRLNRNYEYPIDVIQRFPFFGVGFGHYSNPYTGEVYPHNIFLEVLCEMGFVGFFLLSFVTVRFWFKNKCNISMCLPNGAFAMLVALPYFTRALISLDIAANIIVFSLVFILFNNFKRLLDEKDSSYSLR